MKLSLKLLTFILFNTMFITSFGQYIKLDGRQFKDENGADFYPMVMNYYVDLAYDSIANNIPPNNLGHTYLAQFIQMGSNGSYNYSNILDGPDRIRQDFYEIRNLGFNVVRLAMAPEKRPGDSGFYFVVNNFNRWAYQASNIKVNFKAPYNSSNERMMFFFNKLEEVIEIAQDVGLKVWIGCVNSGEAINGDTAINDYTEYLIALSDFICSNNMHNVFCYEFFGEPSYVELFKPPPGFVRHTKSEICDIVNGWNDSVKQHDPHHLTTIGVLGIEDPKSWDPNLINVDFTNIHLYLEPKSFEWRTSAYPNGNDPDFLSHCIKRYKDKIYLYDNQIVKPYIISETGFPGEDPGLGSNYNDSIPYPFATYGNEEDGANFVTETFPLIKNSLASGYGWWEFQNKWWFGVPSGSNVTTLANFMEDYFGLLRFGDPIPNDTIGYEKDSVHLRKLAAQTFVNYISNPPPKNQPVYGPVSSSFNMNDPYFNPFDHDINSTVYNNLYGTITGNVRDQFGNPIEGAIITGTSFIGQDPDLFKSDTTCYIYYTFTDKFGDFELRAYDYLPNSPNDLLHDPFGYSDRCIIDLKISAYGSDWIERGWPRPGELPLPIRQDTIYILNSLQTKFNEVVHDVIVPIGTTRNFQGYSSITSQDVIIEGNGVTGGNSDFVARNFISIKDEFFSARGSTVHIFTASLPINCDSIASLGLKNAVNSIAYSSAYNILEREVEVNFMKSDSEFQIKIYPNPNKGLFSLLIIDCKGEPNSIYEFSVLDNMGKEILNGCFRGAKAQVEIKDAKPNIYFIKLKSESVTITKKLIII